MAYDIPNTTDIGQAFSQGLEGGSQAVNRYKLQQLKKEELAQQWKKHLEDIALRRQTEGRLAAAAGDRHKLQMLRMQLANRKLDPMHDVNQYMMLEKMLGGGQSQNGEQQTLPTQEMGEGKGMFTPEGMQDAQQNPQEASGSQGGINYDLLKKHPLLRGYFKNKFKFDPLQEAPQTAAQKTQEGVNKAVTIAEAKSNIKKIDEIEKTAQMLLPYLGKAKTIEDILKTNPNLTGRVTQLADMLGMSKDEDVGRFLSAGQSLQANMAHEISGSGRGGYGVAKLVEKAKPNLGKSKEWNTGVIKELKESMKDSFNQMKSEYERLSNKPFPYKFEQYFEEETGLVPMISPSGKKVMIPADKVQAALASGGKHG